MSITRTQQNPATLDRTQQTVGASRQMESMMLTFQVVRALAVATALLATLGCDDDPAGGTATSEEEQAVVQVVERFLRAAGRYDLDSIPLLFTANANIAATSRRDGESVSSTWAIDEWVAALRARPNPRPYTEPVSEFTVRVDNGQLAFVRADATLMRDGRAQSHNIDYFTLILQGGTWKILSGSYTTTPLDSEGG